jgi:hypothetical protein
MRLQNAIRTFACALSLLLCQLATAADAPVQSHVLKRSGPAASGHAKASSFAPREHSTSHVYGAPIEAPILKYRKPAHKQAPKPVNGSNPSSPPSG